MKKRIRKIRPWAFLVLTSFVFTTPLHAQVLKATVHINGMI